RTTCPRVRDRASRIGLKPRRSSRSVEVVPGTVRRCRGVRPAVLRIDAPDGGRDVDRPRAGISRHGDIIIAPDRGLSSVAPGRGRAVRSRASRRRSPGPPPGRGPLRYAGSMPPLPFVPVIPAGGAGTRLWPLSRRARPKFLLDLTGTGRSLLQSTVERLSPLADRPPIGVTGAAHEAAVREQLAGVGPAQVVAEPSPRNSMPAIALAAALVERDAPEAVIGSFAADHLIDDPDAFADSVAVACAAAEGGYLVTVGIAPTRPATGFGYIERAAPGRRRAPGTPGPLPAGAHPVTRFVEKPDRGRAEEFLATGRFLWNAGMFVVKASVLLDELARQIPSLAAGAREIAAAHG